YNTNPIWYKDAGLRRNVAHGLGLCLVIATNGYQAGLPTGFQAMPTWQKF
ncbi:hexose transporter protein, partial [Cryptococcus neoformans]